MPLNNRLLDMRDKISAKTAINAAAALALLVTPIYLQSETLQNFPSNELDDAVKIVSRRLDFKESDSMDKSLSSVSYSPVNCEDLLAKSDSESKSFLIDRPYLKSAEYDPTTGKNTTPVFSFSPWELENILANALDPNLGTKLIRQTKNETVPGFLISLHRPEIDGLRWGIFTKGEYYERKNTYNFVTLLEESAASYQDGSDNGIVLDVGMNIGWFSLLGAACGRNVISFDPNPMHHVRVCQAKLANNWYQEPSFDHNVGKPKVENYLKGVGDKPGKLKLAFDIKSTGSATFTDDNAEASHYKEADVITLDSFAKSKGWINDKGEPISQDEDSFHISMMKVDVEGFEASVFEGASQLLNSGLVKYLLTELTLIYQKGTIDKHSEVHRAISALSSSGFRLVYVADTSGSFSEFKASNRDDFPVDATEPDYVDRLTDWLYDFVWKKHNRHQANMLWAPNDANLGGILSGF